VDATEFLISIFPIKFEVSIQKTLIRKKFKDQNILKTSLFHEF